MPTKEVVAAPDISKESLKVCKKLRQLLKQSKWTYAELAKKTGIPRTTVRRIDEVGTELKYKQLLAYAKAYNLSLAELCEEKPKKNKK